MCARGIDCALVAEYPRPIGVLTSRDVLHAVAARTHSSEARARQWMTAEPIVVPAATATLEIAEIWMAEHGIHHLPVVDGQRPVGMVGMRDVARSTFGAGVGLGF